MKTDIEIINKRKQDRLIKGFSGFIKSKQKALEQQYGLTKSIEIAQTAKNAYPEIVQVLPTFNSSMYDSLMVVASKLAALKKGMKAAGISTEEFVKFNIEQNRIAAQKIPGFLRKIIGKIYTSAIMRRYLGSVAKTISKNGWPTKLINGKKSENFVMSIETRNCQMVAFFERLGEGDIKPYCTFFDFTSAEALGIGLRQVSRIESGVCKYCFSRKGEVEWPESIRKIINH